MPLYIFNFKEMSGFFSVFLLILCAVAFSSCSDKQNISREHLCHIVIEEGEGFEAERYAFELEQGDPLIVSLTAKDGYEITGTDYKDASVLYTGGKKAVLRLDEAKYTTAIAIVTEKMPYLIRYHINMENDTDIYEMSVGSTHLRANTLRYEAMPERAGYTCIGWNTEPDGSGRQIGFGSRVDVREEEVPELYARWVPWTDKEFFITEENREGMTITGFDPDLLGEDKTELLVIPEKIDDRPVTEIADHALEGLPFSGIVVSPSVRKIGMYAFQDAQAKEVILYDNLLQVSDYSFRDCSDLRTLSIQAAVAPVYSGSYYDTFPDKMDYLRSISKKKKLVLFSGSSARFGYDSAFLEENLEGYKVSNMGVFAYTNALPQLELIRRQMNEGDILLVSPEFDAAKRQFCTTNAFDDDFFCMIEADYDLLRELDLSEYTKVFSSFSSYLSKRRGMEERDYSISASFYDEDGNPVSSPSYNAYGDYIVHRKNADSDKPVYGLPLDYTVSAFPEELYIKPANREYQRFQDDGIQVLFTYAPRNRQAISKQSTKEERDRLDAYLREKLCVPVISTLEESLYPGHLLYGTDNHLSDEGVMLRSRMILDQLKKVLAHETG